MITTDQVIYIGKITRTHGKRGEVQCLMDNEYWDNADATFLILSINNILVPFRVIDWRGKGSDSLIFQLDRFNDEQEAQVVATIVNQTPKDNGFPVEMNWTAPLLRDWMERTFGVSFSVRGTRDLLYRLGLSYTKPTYTLEKANPIKQAAFLEEFEQAKKN